MKLRKKYDGVEIAIIGISSRFPMSSDYLEFWDNLKKGNELIKTYSDEELIISGVPPDAIKEGKYIKSFGELADKDRFDYGFFGYTPEEAALMDPQIRLFHEQCWSALEDAAYTSLIDTTKIGLFAGASINENWKIYAYNNSEKTSVDPFFLNTISNQSFIGSLVSYKMNFRGPTYYIDTACSTSLVAIHMACRSLLMKECSIALAGAASIKTNKQKGSFYKEGMVASLDGHCRTFDAEAGGTALGEGVGVVVLKRLNEAIKDKDHIYAIVKSSTVNNDGNRKVSYTAPSVQGQMECISGAIKLANIDVKDIGYVEAHGTATKLGDPIEIMALNGAFGVGGESKFCAVGSVKSNIGHLDTAAGVAGLIKTALCLKYKKIPASLHFREPNPEIDFKNGPFYVSDKLTDWIPNNGETLYAGVNSLGIGGTNAHFILEQAPEMESFPSARKYRILNVSGKTRKSVIRYIKKLYAFLSDSDPLNLDDMSYTLQVGRRHFSCRKALLYQDKNDLLELLAKSVSEERIVKNKGIAAPLVFMFSGAGSQYLNMGKDLYLTEPVFRAEMDKGFELLLTITGIDYFDIFYPDQDHFKINDMLYTQPAIFIFEYALAQLAIAYGIIPKCMIGHSIGEYVAAAVSGAFSYEDALKIVVKRGELMNSLPWGEMLSAYMDRQSAEKYLHERLSLAAVNSENHVVFSGTSGSISELTLKLDCENISWTRLNVTRAGHSFMVDEIVQSLKNELASITINKPVIPFISGVTGRLITDHECMSTEYWARHLRETVNFSDGIKTISSLNKGCIYIEVGPGSSLTNLLKHQETGQGLKVFNLIRHPKEVIDDSRFFINNIGQLWEQAVDINWTFYHQAEQRNRVSLPTYSFEPIFFPAEVDPFSNEINSGTILAGTADDGTDPTEDGSVYRIEKPELSTEFAPAVTNTEVVLKNLFELFFGYENIGVNDNFFELGGDSLKAMMLLKRITRQFDVNLTLADFFEKPFIRNIAFLIDGLIWLKSDVQMDNEINI